jgi:hypothetical protein
LVRDVNAIVAAFDHALDASHMSFNTSQTVKDVRGRFVDHGLFQPLS